MSDRQIYEMQGIRLIFYVGNGEKPCQRCVNYSIDCGYADYVAPLRAIDTGNIEQLETLMASMEQLF